MYLTHTPIGRYRTLYTLKQAAEELTMSVPTIRRRIKDGTIRSVWIGGAQRIPHSELVKLCIGPIHHGQPAIRRKKES
jgi:excisionase family DNA binding protein